MSSRIQRLTGTSHLSLFLCMIPGVAGFSICRDIFQNRNPNLTSQRYSLATEVYGGDFAGHSATFSSKTGLLIPVPEHLLPASLIEWDSIPSCFEVITSEDFDEEQHHRIRRNIVTVIPEVGCGVDNLDTILSTEDLLIHDVNVDCTGQVVAVSQSINKNIHIQNLESTFATLNQSSETHASLKRTRISLEVDMDRCIINSPIRIVVERRTSSESTKGKIAQGGGLDGRTVASLIGKDAYNIPFSDEPGRIIDPSHPKLDLYNKTVLSLPGNAVIWYGMDESTDFVIYMSLWKDKTSEIVESPTMVQWSMNKNGVISVQFF